ncbi:MAG: DUF1501 domain-containing protein [Planctomycetes bacterium]|nr:DUF1501 domain-containing protein [Planctomycetota bacterium]
MTSQSLFDRRNFLVGGTALLGGCMAASNARTQRDATTARDADGRILVLVELYGGNDGLNTIVPYADDEYWRRRPVVNVPKDGLLGIDDYCAFNPLLANVNRQWHDGRLAIVRGVGYPEPVYSHFKSFEIWHTAREAGRPSGDGWIGRLRNTAWKDDPRAELVVHVGGAVPHSLHSSEHQTVAFATPESFVWAGDALAQQAYEQAAAATSGMSPKSGRDAMRARLSRTLADAQVLSPRVLKATLEYQPQVEYPTDEFGRALRCVAGMIDARLGGRVYSVQLGNFDTHATQADPQSRLLSSFDAGIGAFLADLKGRSQEKDVLVFAFSEFGRRVSENYSKGTDHGAAGPAFFLGAPVKGGFYGEHPSLAELDRDENLIMNVDFRRLYATVLEDWFRADASAVLPKRYEPLPLLA